MRHPKGKAETVEGMSTVQVPQSDRQLEPWLQCCSAIGILLRQPQEQEHKQDSTVFLLLMQHLSHELQEELEAMPS